MIRTAPILIRRIAQLDNHRFVVEWNDGKVGTYSLSELQRHCPCAGCVDEKSGRRVVDPAAVEDTVRCKTIRNVGRYALRIQFTSGCSNGIYGFDMLRQLETTSV